ncbi:MAG TPA: YbfB/YjiJ family MFS transporter [Alphaproteobacteria bacterium]|nr:YbfB/YjiJ family MFS transporter [Alphaproteobacteria bacterium]
MTCIAAAPARPASPLWVAFGLALGPAATLGLARFAYALLLPAMRADLGWSYAQAGAMNTVNAVGYLLGSLVAAGLAARRGSRASFLVSMAVTALALLASAATRDFALLLLLRLVAGVSGAVTLVAGAGLAAHAGAGDRGRPALVLGIYFGGGGFGIVASALTTPLLIGVSPAGWPHGWIALGLTGLAATLLAVPAARRSPAPELRAKTPPAPWSRRALLPTFASYFLFGAGYIGYMTFIIAFLRGEGFRGGAIAAFWSILGAAGIAGAFLWGPMLARLRGGWGMAAMLAVVTAGSALPLLPAGPGTVYASALLFGGTFLAEVAAVVAFARKATPVAAWTPVIGALTTAFALGQCLGPVLAGVLSDVAGAVRAGLVLSAVILALAALLATLQREPRGQAGAA